MSFWQGGVGGGGVVEAPFSQKIVNLFLHLAGKTIHGKTSFLDHTKHINQTILARNNKTTGVFCMHIPLLFGWGTPTFNSLSIYQLLYCFTLQVFK
jgi:hypothetical protein